MYSVVFTWNFRPFNKSEEMPIIEHSNKTTKLVFDRIQIKNAGTDEPALLWTRLDQNYLNMSSFVYVYVKYSERMFTGCEQCGYIETCQHSIERTVCNLNIWVPITVIFILLSVVSSNVLINATTKKTIYVEKRYVSLSCSLFYILLHTLQYSFFI